MTNLQLSESPMSDLNALLPCPFCGGQAAFDGSNVVCCEDCSCTLCLGLMDFSRDELAEAWNRRALSPLAPAEGERTLDAMIVIDPDQWEPCSPSYLERGGSCAAPRVWNAAEQNHWHPKLAPKPAEGEAVPVAIGYTNWRGECAVRKIIPSRVWFGATEWHPEPQWLLTAIDVEKNAERDFAIKDIGIAAAPISPAAVTEGERFPKTLSLIHSAIDGYVDALVSREHGGVAENRAFAAICEALGRSPTQEMDARRTALTTEKGKANG